MGNANGREDGSHDEHPSRRSNGVLGVHENHAPPGRVASSDSPPASPRRSRSPLLFAPQVPVAPLHRDDGSSFLNQTWLNESSGVAKHPHERGIPTLITWNHGGQEVAVEGSWDNWTAKKLLKKAGKDHSILLVLPAGVYHYKFIVDGEYRYIPDLPHIADEMGRVCNLLDVDDYVPENPESVSEFEAPPSPESSYGCTFPAEEDFAKEPATVPPQLHLSVRGMENAGETAPSRPKHVVLNHLFIEKGLASQSVMALGMTHRFQSKYVTAVLYKPLKR